LIAQFEPGNTSTEITLPDSVWSCILLVSPESITDALYKAALIVKKTRAMEALKKEKKTRQQQHHQQQQLKETAEKKAEDAKRSAAEESCNS
jgi:Sec-independent protein translocase protein TatA